MDLEEKEPLVGLEKVIFSARGEYSIWPADRLPPPHWQETGKSGSRGDCIAYIQTMQKREDHTHS